MSCNLPPVRISPVCIRLNCLADFSSSSIIVCKQERDQAARSSVHAVLKFINTFSLPSFSISSLVW